MDKKSKVHASYRILLSLKNEQSLIHATTSKNLRDTMLSEISQVQKGQMLVPLIQDLQNTQIHKDINCHSGCQGLREGTPRSQCVKSTEFPLKMKNFWR